MATGKRHVNGVPPYSMMFEAVDRAMQGAGAGGTTQRVLNELMRFPKDEDGRLMRAVDMPDAIADGFSIRYWRKAADIADALGISTDSVRRCVGWLVRKGIIAREEDAHRGRCAVYSLSVDLMDERVTQASPIRTGADSGKGDVRVTKGDVRARKGDAHVPERVTPTVPPEEIEDHHTEDDIQQTPLSEERANEIPKDDAPLSMTREETRNEEEQRFDMVQRFLGGPDVIGDIGRVISALHEVPSTNSYGEPVASRCSPGCIVASTGNPSSVAMQIADRIDEGHGTGVLMEEVARLQSGEIYGGSWRNVFGPRAWGGRTRRECRRGVLMLDGKPFE